MLRELRESDAEEVAALFQTVYGDERPIDAEEIVSWANNSEVKTEWMRVLELDGRVVGYGDIMIEDDEVALDAAAPGGHWDTFFEWAEEQALAEVGRESDSSFRPDITPRTWRGTADTSSGALPTR